MTSTEELEGQIQAQDCELEYWFQQAENYAEVQIPADDLRAIIARTYAAVNALPELVERVKRYEAALKKIDAGHLPDLEGKPNVLDYAIATRVFYMKLARAALNQEPGQ